ncbi:MAG: type II secretion system GspH family protein [Psychrosphaera sp.]|nr:type II secretion system GspH family protein [Psychrosphaera sp.]
MKPFRMVNQGFTLIELMIVILVMGLLAGLVAPLTFKQLDKSRAKTEFLKLRNTIKSHTTKAFTQGVSYRIETKDQTLTALSVLGQKSYTFKYLQMPEQFFIINANGFPSIDKFELTVAGQPRQITMEDMLGVKQDLIYAKTK